MASTPNPTAMAARSLRPQVVTALDALTERVAAVHALLPTGDERQYLENAILRAAAFDGVDYADDDGGTVSFKPGANFREILEAVPSRNFALDVIQRGLGAKPGTTNTDQPDPSTGASSPATQVVSGEPAPDAGDLPAKPAGARLRGALRRLAEPRDNNQQ